MTTAALAQEQTVAPHKLLHVGLWFAQVALAGLFFMAGLTKLTTPNDQLVKMMPWVSGAMGPLVRFIGSVEVLGAVGLILPSLTRIKAWLTPLAALGLFTVMALASLTHLSRGELQILPFNAALGGLAAFVAWGRARKRPIESR
jgi:putative oxidoreductase